jgi:hypothetical protein
MISIVVAIPLYNSLLAITVAVLLDDNRFIMIAIPVPVMTNRYSNWANSYADIFRCRGQCSAAHAGRGGDY